MDATTGIDDRVQKLINLLHFEHEIMDDHNYKLVFQLDEGRSQAVFINSETEKFGNLEIREIWSVAHVVSGLIDPLTSNHLLEDSNMRKIGAWQVVNSGGHRAIAYVAKVPADLDPEGFVAVLEAVTEAADQMERLLSGGDQF